jgi:membrane fusion protein, multidrug efflux system
MLKLSPLTILATLAVIAAIGLIAVVMRLGAHPRSDQGAAWGRAVQVGFVTLSSGKVEISTELTGRTAPTLVAQVRPQVSGLLEARMFEEGATVAADQPLYRVEQRPYIAARDQAAAALVNAQANLVAAQAQADRYRSLTDIDAVSKQQIDNAIAAAGQAKATVQQNEAALEAARVALDETIIRAPISGRINRSLITVGALMTANQTDVLTTIEKLDPIFVDITQSSDALLALRGALDTGKLLPGATTVRLKLANGSYYPENGVLKFSEVSVDETTGTVTLRASFPNPHGLLLPGMFVRVEIPQGVAPAAVLAPQQGIGRDAKGNATALLIGSDGKVVERQVQASQMIGDKWLVTSGLKAGDRLIVEGTDKVRPGMTAKGVPMNLSRGQ